MWAGVCKGESVTGLYGAYFDVLGVVKMTAPDILSQLRELRRFLSVFASFLLLFVVQAEQIGGGACAFFGLLRLFLSEDEQNTIEKSAGAVWGKMRGSCGGSGRTGDGRGRKRTENKKAAQRTGQAFLFQHAYLYFIRTERKGQVLPGSMSG